jgi:hypothetical protein
MSRFFDSEIAKTNKPQRGAECAHDSEITQTVNQQLLIDLSGVQFPSQ